MEKIDSSILQITPKGSYYNTAGEQMLAVQELWTDFMEYDRVIFSLSMILNGTAYAKGRMSHMLLSKPMGGDPKALIPYGLGEDFESKIILFNLLRERTPLSLKNLMMLAGVRDKDKNITLKRVNNSRARKVILDYVFNRPSKSLEAMSVKYKPKLKKLVRHALGRQTLYNVINDSKSFDKHIGKYNDEAFPIVQHLFDHPIDWNSHKVYFRKIDTYYQIRDSAREGDTEKFKEVASRKELPFETVLGFRNTFKLDIPRDWIIENTQMTARQKVQMESAAKKVGVDLKIDYSRQDIYDLWKLFYHKVNNGEEVVDDLVKAIHVKIGEKEKSDLTFGKSVIIFDCSDSMKGSPERPWHPFYTGLSLIGIIRDVIKTISVGGTIAEVKHETVPGAVVPMGSTELWRALVEAVTLKPDTIIVISDGYENAPKGLFEKLYDHFKGIGFEFNLVHINPVFAAEASGAKRIVKDVQPMVVTNYKFLETQFIFEQLQTHRDQVKDLLINKFNRMIGDGRGGSGA